MQTASFLDYRQLWRERVESVMRQKGQWSADSIYTDLSRAAFEWLTPPANRLTSFFCGTDRGCELPNPDLAQILNFCPRLLNCSSVAALPEPLGNEMASLVRRSLLLGLANHMVGFDNPIRAKVPEVSRERLLIDCVRVAGIADQCMKQYNDMLKRLPSAVADAQFEGEVSPYLKSRLSIGFWKMGKFSSHFKNIFWVGSLLGMRADTLAGETVGERAL